MFLEKAPGSMFRLGVGFKDREVNHPLHHPKFEVDESAIITGVVTFAYAAYKYWELNSNTTKNLAPVTASSNTSS